MSESPSHDDAYKLGMTGSELVIVQLLIERLLVRVPPCYRMSRCVLEGVFPPRIGHTAFFGGDV